MGGICWQGSLLGCPPIRQIAPGKRVTGVTAKPADPSACVADDGSPLAHRVCTELPVSTTTVTPEVPVQAAPARSVPAPLDGAAGAAAAPPAPIIATAPSARAARAPRREPRRKACRRAISGADPHVDRRCERRAPRP